MKLNRYPWTKKSNLVGMQIKPGIPLHSPRSQYCVSEHASIPPHLHVPLSHVSVLPVHFAFDPHLQIF